MSLFDILKYQNIDLDNYDALLELPNDLIKLFWIKAHESISAEIPHRDKNKDKDKMCDALSKWCRYLDSRMNELKIEAFKKALKEYSNVNI